MQDVSGQVASISAEKQNDNKSTSDWTPSSWRSKKALHQPNYPDQEDLDGVLHHLSELTPLVTSWEIQSLRKQLGEAALGKRFLLQGGDCAESFNECSSDIITRRLKVILQMSLVLIYGLKLPVIRVGRFAGQYAKPRSADVETVDGVTLPTYKGDMINGMAFNEKERTPSPQRLLLAHSRSAMTLNFVRALVEGGFADLHHPEYWDLDFVQHSSRAGEYQSMVDYISEAVSFMQALSDVPEAPFGRTNFYTSHEALFLPYEESQTRSVPHNPGCYNLSTHMPWIGMRTAFPDSAHIEYMRGISNPIGMKVGAALSSKELIELIDILDPNNDPGRLTLIARFGHENIADHLPRLVEAVKKAGKTVVWSCDPMHGNTIKTEKGIKTRPFENILSELEQSLDIHAELGSHLGGVHFEMTGEDVTECTGGARGLADGDLERAYTSRVDPRLNAEQALEIAMSIVRKWRRM
ncbi:MAG: class II 3-deoxy-7-phosphoheptulonate synthase [Rhodothermales bacterium]